VDVRTLISDLQQGDPSARRRAAYILGTVDETDALDALAAQYKHESDPDAREAILWAGRRLRSLAESGYRTLDAIIQHFRIDASTAQDDDERRLVDEITTRSQMSTIDSSGRGAALNIVARMALLPPMITMLGGAARRDLQTQVDEIGLDRQREQVGRRISPVQPGETDITPYRKRLLHDPDPAQRMNAALDLAQLCNNPAALPYLAAAFVRDSDEQVREAAHRAAKHIYWNALYWQMSQDGSLDAAMTNRAGERPPARTAPSDEQDIGDILRKAEAEREKRRRSQH
jgi:hypothetical protein